MEQKILVSPVKKYAPPKYPSLDEAGRDPELLRKLPPRWRNNAKVVAAVGMLGAMTLTSCGGRITSQGDSEITETPVISEITEAPVITKFPRLPGLVVPSYILSEQDVLAIVKEMAESAGLNFDADPPDYADANLKLYDSEKQVAVAYSPEYAEDCEPGGVSFYQSDFAVGVFCNNDYSYSKEGAEEFLRAQVRDFIEWLQGQGII